MKRFVLVCFFCFITLFCLVSCGRRTVAEPASTPSIMLSESPSPSPLDEMAPATSAQPEESPSVDVAPVESTLFPALTPTPYPSTDDSVSSYANPETNDEDLPSSYDAGGGGIELPEIEI